MKAGFSKKKWSSLLVLALLAIVGIRFYLRENVSHLQVASHQVVEAGQSEQQQAATIPNIAQLTNGLRVINFVKEHQHLPDYYLTKREAREKGWQPEKGNLCQVLPGKAIGGDRFGNREGKLPKKSGRNYFEADINYHCGRRNAERLIYSNDGLFFITKDHYRTFKRQ